MEPHKKRRWRRKSSSDAILFYTCARPGRSKGRQGNVKDQIVDLWIKNLPQPNTTIVSLLGTKPDGTNEYSFYSFYPKETFQKWLDRRHGALGIRVIEHPTTDFSPILEDDLKAIVADIERLLSEGRTVVLIDSGGETRSGKVCKHMDLVEDTRSL